jgi:hypothetical protein
MDRELRRLARAEARLDEEGRRIVAVPQRRAGLNALIVAAIVVAVVGALALSIYTRTTGSPQPQPLGKSGSWTLAFDDEFDGTTIDRTKWPSIDGWRIGNVTTRDANVSVSGGNAILKLVSSSEGAVIASKPFDGSGVGYTLPVGSFTEARISFPGQDTTIYNWPGWWASGPSYPAAGEHDIAEGLGTMTVNYHSSSGKYNQGTIPGTWSNDFHTYGLYRGAGFAEVYYDGVLVKSYPTDDNGNGESLIVNMGSGHTAQIPSQLLVDYVRAWKPR